MKKTYKTLIVDDERLARKDLKSLLSEYSNIEIVGEAESVQTAINFIKDKSPDLIFLDIQMPGQSGFELINSEDIHAKIIFVTAFNEFAVRAFEADAIDYLLKPVNPDRLRLAVDRLDKIDALFAATKRKLRP